VTHLLHLDSSVDAVNSTSRAITATFAKAFTAADPRNTVTYRDLRTDAPPFLTDPEMHWAPAGRTPGSSPDPVQMAWQETLLAELLAADVLLIGAPMYTWSVGASLKSWLEYIHVLGITAALPDEQKPMFGRPAVVVSSRGAQYGPGTPSDGWDHLVPALEVVLGTSMGMDVTAIIAELMLAERIEQLAEHRPQRLANLAAAHASAADLGARLGSATS
jgi:FMN-dependent NADH-azoreductase